MQNQIAMPPMAVGAAVPPAIKYVLIDGELFPINGPTTPQPSVGQQVGREFDRFWNTDFGPGVGKPRGLMYLAKEASPGQDVQDMLDGSANITSGVMNLDAGQAARGLGDMALGAVGFIPGYGDAAKAGIRKSVRGTKVVDDAGEPLKVYHGTAAGFHDFEKGKRGAATGSKSTKYGFWFTDDPITAKSYADFHATDTPVKRLLKEAEDAERAGNWGLYDKKIIEMESLDSSFRDVEKRLRGQNIRPSYLEIKNPFEYDAKGETFTAIEDGLTGIIQKAKLAGNDGVIIRNLDDAAGLANRPSTHYLVFKEDQIVGAIDGKVNGSR